MCSDNPCHHFTISRLRARCASPGGLTTFSAFESDSTGFISPALRLRICSRGTRTSNTSLTSASVNVTVRPLCENRRTMLKRDRGMGWFGPDHGFTGKVVCSQSDGWRLWIADE